MKRYLAHCIVYQGRQYRMSVARIADDGTVTIAPYTEETHSTIFVPGTLDLDNMENILKPDKTSGKSVAKSKNNP